jgi:transposase
MKSQKNWAVISSRCCNPFKEQTHQKCTKGLRNVTEWMCSLDLDLNSGMKICDKCRKKIYEIYKADEEVLPCSSQSLDDSFTDTHSSIDYLNKSLELIGESPFKKKKINVPAYATKKLDKIKLSLEKSLLPESNQEQPIVEKLEEAEIIQQLKEKFAETTKRSDRMTILTVLPKSWSIKKIQDEFGVSNYMARAVKKLVKENGILSTPNPKPGKTLNENVVELVKDFSNSDDVNRIMPGKKDCVSIRNKEGKIQVQKRLVLANLKEIYQLFKEKFPTSQIGFSKFCELRPKNCILAGKSGTHTVCVCTLHQNIKLMMTGAKMQNFVLDDETSLKSYHSCLAKIMCNPPSQHCYMNTCKECLDVSNFKELLSIKFNEEMIDEVTYKKWVTVDRCTMETVVKGTDDFIDDFLELLLKLKTHAFISNQQKEHYSEIKENLIEGNVVANCDFAENYSFIIQDEIQSFHWTTSQATIHPFIIYYKWEGKLKNLQYVFISDCLEHDTVAFYVFQKKLLEILKETLPFELKKITYFSDGSAAQYKNRKNFYNLCLHKQDFGIEAEWQFFATSHGKSACDGLGGTVKRLAAKASLQRPYDDQILTPRQLYDFATENIKSIDFEFCTKHDYEETQKFLLNRFSESKAIVGTQKFHSFVPVSENKIVVKPYYSSQEESLECVTLVDQITPTDLECITSGFVTVAYDNSWWLGCIEEKDASSNVFKINFLHPKGPARSFFYPQSKDVLVVPGNTLLQKVDPSTATGRTYTLSADEMKLSSLALENYCKRL